MLMHRYVHVVPCGLAYRTRDMYRLTHDFWGCTGNIPEVCMYLCMVRGVPPPNKLGNEAIEGLAGQCAILRHYNLRNVATHTAPVIAIQWQFNIIFNTVSKDISPQ